VGKQDCAKRESSFLSGCAYCKEQSERKCTETHKVVTCYIWPEVYAVYLLTLSQNPTTKCRALSH